MAKNSKRKYWIIGLLLLLIAVVAISVMKFKSKPKGIEITTEKAAKRTILETVSASGKVFPETEIKISSDVSGEIVELYVEEGDSVVIGQLLAKIDPDAYMSAVERGKASVNSARSQVSMSKSQIQSSIAQKEQIVAQLENARTIHKRNTQLKTDGVISSQEYEQSESNLRGLEANLRASEASIESAKQSTEGAAYSVKSAEASLKELKTNLNRTTIKAPASGIISSLSVEQGERVVGTIQMAGTEMMRVANLNAMEVQVDVSENDILRVKVGDKVEIEVDAYLDKTFTGRVTEIANSASNIVSSGMSLNTGTVTNFVVKIRIDPESYKSLVNKGIKYPFRPGMSASVDIQTHQVDDALTVPIQSVTTREADKNDSIPNKSEDEELLEVVFIMEGDSVRMQEVSSDIQDDDYIIITKGIKEGDNIVTGPYSAVSKKLENGEQVRLKEEDKDKDGKRKS